MCSSCTTESALFRASCLVRRRRAHLAAAHRWQTFRPGIPPPAQYAASSQYFPSSWNNDMVSRYTIDLR